MESVVVSLEQIRSLYPSYEALYELETLQEGQYSNLKVQTTDYELWLDRSSIRDYGFDDVAEDAASQLVIVQSPAGDRIGVYIADSSDDRYDAYRREIFLREA